MQAYLSNLLNTNLNINSKSAKVRYPTNEKNNVPKFLITFIDP